MIDPDNEQDPVVGRTSKTRGPWADPKCIKCKGEGWITQSAHVGDEIDEWDVRCSCVRWK